MTWVKAFTRRKCISKEEIEDSQLDRVLSIFDLTALGVGSTLGVGIYVLAGEVSKNVAGPAVVLSFVLAAIVSILSGLSFAELSARVPKAGSAYIYTYICIGEFVAFIIGWSLVLEYAIGAASVAKGISTYIDSLIDHTMRDLFLRIAPMDIPFLSAYVDFFAFLLCLVLSAALAGGVRLSTYLNNIFTTCNILVVVFFIVTGMFLVDTKNWSVEKEEIPDDIEGGQGGFLPFGISGVISGAAICFYGFVGFDCVATTGEEVRNPQRAIPTAIIASLSIVMLAYVGVSSVLTLIFPYYLQDPDAPIPYAFEAVGWNFAKWIVGVGALFGLFSSLFGGLFPLPRIIYAMANDGLLFQQLGVINSYYKTPVTATLISGFGTAILSAFFNLQQLVGLNALGTLLIYTIVSVCVIILRFEDGNISETTQLLPGHSFNSYIYLKQFVNTRANNSNKITSSIVVFNILLFCAVSLVTSIFLTINSRDIYDGDFLAVTTVTICFALLLLLSISIATQPRNQEIISFKTPFVPYLPCISIFVNIYLMVVLDGLTWLRFLIAMLIGICIYLFYGMRHSLERNKLISE